MEKNMKVNLIIEPLPFKEEVEKANKWKQQLEDNKISDDDKRLIIKEIRREGIHINYDYNGDINLCLSTSCNLADEFGMNIAMQTLINRYESRRNSKRNTEM